MKFTTIHAAAEQLHSGRLTPLALLEACLEQVERYDGGVRAWVFVDRDRARAEAERLTVELHQGRSRGLLHGIPLGIKDIIDVFDWPTAAGSGLWAQSIARRDATVVGRLRQAGAVFVGKTVTTQFASFDPPVTRNPWNRLRTPGGSSSGSAAAVACGMCLGALASQTGGSITRPASYCGVPSCKPTFGRVSTDGFVPLAFTMDHPGPMAACVKDLVILLQTIGGPDPRDSQCSTRPMPDLLAALARAPAEPPTFGRLRGFFEDLADPGMRDFIENTAARLQKAGANVIEIALPAEFADVVACHRTVMAVEAASFHEYRLRRHPEDYAHMIRRLLEEGLACSASEYARCKEHQRQLGLAMASRFEGVDALLTPATTGPAPDAGTTGDPAFNSPWSYTGLPTVSLPAGWSADGLPLAIQLVGPAWGEAKLFASAAWCERALRFERREPPVP